MKVEKFIKKKTIKFSRFKRKITIAQINIRVEIFNVKSTWNL